MELKFRPFGLRIDYGRWNGLVFTDNPQPVFSWAVQATGENQYQSACSICIEHRGRTVWASGWIEQKEQSLSYAGEPLESSTKQ